VRSRRGIVRSQGYSSHSPGPEETRHGVPSNRIRLKPSVCLAVVWRALAGRHGQPSVHATGTTRPTQRVSQAVDPMGSSRGWSGAPRDAWACLPSCSRANVPAAHRWGRSIAPVTDHATAVRRHRRRNEPHGRRCGSRVYGVDRQGVRTFAATPFDRGAALPAGVDARSARWVHARGPMRSSWLGARQSGSGAHRKALETPAMGLDETPSATARARLTGTGAAMASTPTEVCMVAVGRCGESCGSSHGPTAELSNVGFE
jgi:hypothetical protein